MHAGDIYKVGYDYTATFEKKGALGMWSKKFVKLTGLKFSVSDSESAAANQAFELGTVIQAENADPLCLTVRNVGNTDSVVLRGERAMVDAWYELGRTALEFAGRAKPRDPGLPSVDPRFGIKFASIPVEYRHRFTTLESAVIYWFQPVKKFGVASKLNFSGKFSTEERVVIVGDKAIYVTKPDSEVTRCMKVSMMSGLFTNASVRRQGEEGFVVIKMESPDYDLYFQSEGLEEFCQVMQAIYRGVQKGKELNVHTVNSPTDASVDLKLVRPEGFTMAMVVPTTKAPLKKALDDFATKHGIRLTTSGSAEGAKPAAGAKKAGAASSSAPAAGGSSASGKSDALTRFMLSIGLPETLKKLQKQHVDFTVLRVMEEDDYVNFGLSKEEARKVKTNIEDEALLAAIDAGEEPAPRAASSGLVGGARKAPERGGGFDDLDDDLDLPPPKATGKATIDFDDLDIDIDASLAGSASTAKFVGNINLDSDDDLDLPPPKPKAAPKPVVDIDDI